MNYHKKLSRREDGNKYSFYIIDESNELVNNLTEIISGYGGEVVGSSTTAADAQNIINQGSVEFNFVIIDIFMPGIDDLNVIPQIKDMNKDIQIIMVCESIDATALKESFMLGEKYFITKPYAADQIFNILQEACDDLRNEQEDAAMLIWNKSKAVNAMIVEDSRLTTKLLTAHLEWFACNVVASTCCGKEAIYELNKQTNGIDLIVMGLVQQDMKYDRLINELISIKPDIVIVVISATEKKEVIDEVSLLGAKGFISKTDFSQKKLYRVLKKIFPN